MKLRSAFAALLREPLVHFVVAGALVYALLAGRPPDLGERRVVVNEAVVGQLVDRWTQTYHRAPSPSELDGLIAEYVRDQVYYREALRLGLDKDDEVVVRRMRNKMVALATSTAEAANPSDAQLQAWLDRDPARYAPEPRFGFEQIYLGANDPAGRKAARASLTEIQRGADPQSFGKPVPIPTSYRDTPASEVSALMGDEFTAALRTLPLDRWSGPVVSGFGLHLVKVAERTAPAKPTLTQVRQRVENDWRSDALHRAEEEDYRRILAGYDVRIEMPK